VAGDTAGNVYNFAGNTWSTPVQIDTSALTVTSISCPSADFCMAVDDAGDAVMSGTPGSSGGGGGTGGGTGPSSNGSVSATATVNQVVSLTGLSGTITFPATNPGSTATADAAEAYTTATNDPAGYTLTLTAGGSALTAAGGASIPNTNLTVTETGAYPGSQTFGSASGAALTLAHTAAPSTDSYSENWALAIPGSAVASTYSESFVYLVLGN
jgi:hypothetical protein